MSNGCTDLLSIKEHDYIKQCKKTCFLPHSEVKQTFRSEIMDEAWSSPCPSLLRRTLCGDGCVPSQQTALQGHGTSSRNVPLSAAAKCSFSLLCHHGRSTLMVIVV